MERSKSYKLYKAVGWLSLAVVIAAFAVFLNNPFKVQDKPVLSSPEVQKKGVEGLREYYNIPGFTYCVVKAGKVAVMGASGCIYEGSDRKITTKNYFSIGSVTKSFTGLTAAKLVEEGKISWDTRLLDLYPEWKGSMNAAYSSITLRDLLSHNAGIQPFENNPVVINPDTKKLEYTGMPNFAGIITERRLKFCSYALSLPPIDRKGFTYSNAVYSLAGAMLEKASGMVYEDLAVRTGSELGMKIKFGRPNNINIDEPWGHRVDSAGKIRPVPPDDPYKYDDIFAPAGNITASIEDMARYAAVYLEGLSGREGYLSPENIRYLLYGIPDYSLGWYNVTDGEICFYHNGSEGTFSSQIMIFKELNSAIIILTNIGPGRDTNNFIDGLRNYLKDEYIYHDN